MFFGDRMSQESLFSVAGLYRLASRLHNGIPYRFFSSGYAFPAWHYFLEMTRQCNLRCDMCQYIRWLRETAPAKQAEGDLSTQQWLDVIDQTGRLSLLTFTGGEPWMRQDFAEILEYASVKRRTHYITNATMLNDERCRLSVELAPKRAGMVGLNVIGISLEGPRELHDKIVHQPGAFDKSVGAMKMLSEYKASMGKALPLFHVTVVVQKENLDSLPDLVSAVADAGGHALNLTLEWRVTDTCDVREVEPEKIDMSKVAFPRIDRMELNDALDDTLRKAREVGLDVRIPRMPREQILKYCDGGMDIEKFQCRHPWTNMNVGAQGDVFSCYLYRVGNINDDTLKALWNGERFRKLRQRFRKKVFPACQGCCELEYHDK